MTADRSNEGLHGAKLDVTRDRIMRTLVELILQGGVHGISIQDVADRADVSHRTVYRHFPSKDALLDGLADWLEAEYARVGAPVSPGAPQGPRTPEELPDATRRAYRTFDDYADLVAALVIARDTLRRGSTAQQQRSERFAELLGPLTEHLPPDEAYARLSTLRALLSARTWLQLHDEFGLDGDTAGRAVAWLLEAGMQALRDEAQAHPGRPRE